MHPLFFFRFIQTRFIQYLHCSILQQKVNSFNCSINLYSTGSCMEWCFASVIPAVQYNHRTYQ